MTLQPLSHHVVEPAGRSLEPGHPLAAARIWRAQGMRILAERKSPHCDAAVDCFGCAKRCYARIDRIGEWRKGRTGADRAPAEEHFMPRFQTLVQDADTERQPSILEWAGSRWTLPEPDRS
jgi:hypothetical protein